MIFFWMIVGVIVGVCGMDQHIIFRRLLFSLSSLSGIPLGRRESI